MKNRFSFVTVVLVLLLVCVSVISLLIGAAGISLSEIISALTHYGNQDVSTAIIWEVRIPRIAAGIVVGVATSLAGVLLQSAFANPLVEPSLIGISGLAGVGSIVAGALIDSSVIQTFSAVVFAGLAMWWLTKQKVSRTVFLIMGVAVGSLATSVLGTLALIPFGSEQRSLNAWLFGSLALANIESVIFILISILIAFSLLRTDANILNIVSLGEKQAKHLGVEVHSYKRKWLLISALLIGSSVAAFGIVTFVGLLVPHIARSLGFVLHQQLIMISVLLGAILVVVADSLARVAAAPTELPLSLVLAAFGAPVLIGILKSRAV